MNDNIILIGMAGCGKSTVGVLLAKSLGREFLDTDLIIQRREGMLLQEIINQRGLDAFRTAEEAALYYTIVEETLGKEWLTPELFRIGASSVANNLISAIEGVTVKYF